MHERAELLDKLWEKAEPTVFIQKEEFIHALEEWTLWPFVKNGRLAMIVGERGSEVHFETTGSGEQLPREIFTSTLQRLIDKYGYAVTKTPKEEIRQRRFNELVGFKMVGQDEYDIHYRIEKIRRGSSRRSEACLSSQ